MFSVLILVKDRRDHLENVLVGLELSSLVPDEVIIVHMNEAVYDLHTSLTVKSYMVQDDHSLPLARARNVAVQYATYDSLIFLDADCIPAKDTLAELVSALAPNQFIMADPRYLDKPIKQLTSATDITTLAAGSRPSSSRQQLGYGLSTTYKLFWSLGFAIDKPTFNRIGGFDEQFVGYGGEDTDFAFTARNKGIKLYYATAQVIHQYHPVYEPPLNHLTDIIINAITFYKKWHVWPMEGWLQAFADNGYVNWQHDTLVLIRMPTEEETNAVLID
jgi:GT2 family glycosyltransferase